MSQQINLFNPQFAVKRTEFSGKTMLKGLGLVMVGCVLLTAFLYYRVDVLKESVSTAQARLMKAGGELQQIRAQHAPKTKSQELEAQVQQTEQEMQALARVLDILNKGNIGNTDGYSAYLQALARQSMEGIWLTGFNIVGAGNKVVLEGKAIMPDLLPLYINRLKNEPVFQGKSFGTLEIATSAMPDMQSNASARTGMKADSGQAAQATQAATQNYIDFKLN